MSRPFCNAEFATLGSKPVPKYLRVIRAGFSHEIVVLRFRDRDLSAANYKTGMPISVEWGVFPRYREKFVGYVHHVEPVIESRMGTPPEIELVAVGPTWAIRNERPNYWGHTRSNLVVSQTAQRHRLGSDTDTSPVVRPGLMQPAKSGWGFLIDLAKEDGYFISATGTTINFWDHEKRLQKLRPYAPIFHRGQVSRFMPVTGETNPTGDEAAEMTAYALGSRGLTGFSEATRSGTKSLDAAWRPLPQYSRMEEGAVLANAREAKQHIEAVKRRTARVYKAKAETAAFPPLQAGDPVIFEGYGNRQSGEWVADRVEFTLTTEKITSHLELSRSLVADDGRRPRFPGAKSPARRKSGAALIRGVWVDRSLRA